MKTDVSYCITAFYLQETKRKKKKKTKSKNVKQTLLN